MIHASVVQAAIWTPVAASKQGATALPQCELRPTFIRMKMISKHSAEHKTSVVQL
jgi:hypothetical protein